MKEKNYKTCALCGKQTYIRPSRVGVFKNTFCSREHYITYSKNNAFHSDCKVCGNTYYTQPAQMVLRNRETCSLKCRAKMQSLKAEQRAMDNPPTEGLLRRRIRYSKKMRDWRKAVFERDNYTCQICKTRGGTLNADHIKAFAFFPELRFEITNGRTLCVGCHKQTDSYGGRGREKHYKEKLKLWQEE